MRKTKVIALVGMPGSGKGTCTDYLHEKYDWPLVHFGGMVYDEIQRRKLNNIADETFVREDMRKKEGKEVMAKHALKKVRALSNKGSEVVVFDGLYSWSEYKYLESQLGDNLTVIAIVASKKIRRQRVLDRKDSHRKYTLDQLVKREIGEIENLEKGGPIAYADYTLLNDGELPSMIRKLDEILSQELGLT